MSGNRWVEETLHKRLGFRVGYSVEEVLVDARPEQQELLLFRHPYFGKVLMMDGATQLTDRDEFIYHEMMTHVPLFAHGDARTVLVVGGGDCGIARAALRHPEIERLAQVEIDRAVVDFSRQHFPELTEPVFADKRFELVIDDGMKWVDGVATPIYDVIIVDSTDPQGPGKVLFSREFYAACQKCLRPGGIIVTQNGVPFFQPEELKSSMAHFRELFVDAGCYIAAIPTYVGGHMAMGFAANGLNLRRWPVETIEQRYRAAGSFETHYWTPAVHVASFALPRFIAEIVTRG